MQEPKLEITVYRRNIATKKFDTRGRVLTDVYDADARLGILSIKDTFSFKTNNTLINGSWNNPLGKKVDASNTLQISDLVKVKAWYGTPSTSEIDDIIIYGTITDFSSDSPDSGGDLVINGANITETILNGMVLGTYQVSNSINKVNDIIINIFQQRFRFGPTSPEKTVYAAKTNEYIYDTTKNITPSNAPTGITGSYGHVAAFKTDGTAFKEITYTKAWQIAYNMLEDLSTTPYTGDDNAGAYIFFVKMTPVLPEFISQIGTNYIYELVFEPASTDVIYTLVRGTNYHSISTTKDKTDVINALIVKPGYDCDAVGITTYAANALSIGEVGIKFGYYSKPEIAQTVKANEKAAGLGVGSTFDNNGDYPDAVAAGSAWHFSTIFTRSTDYPYGEDKTLPLNSNTKNQYNQIIRNETRVRGKLEGDQVVKTLGAPRYTASVDLLSGSNIGLGQLVGVRDKTFGWDGTIANPDYKLRVIDVRHKWDNSGWTTTSVLKEDAKVISDRINK